MKRKNIIGTVIIALMSGYVGCKFSCLKKQEVVNESKINDKFKKYYNLLNQWLWLKNNGKKIDDLFIKKGYSTIAIYGMGEIGWRLQEELSESKVNVLYGIDSNIISGRKFDVISLQDELPVVDAIVVTAIFDYENIKNNIKCKTDMEIISLEDILF